MKPLPGVIDKDGSVISSRAHLALAWETQFAEIENANPVGVQHMTPNPGAPRRLSAADLNQLPTLLDLEHALRTLNDSKATGVDSLGAEIYQADTAHAAAKLYPLLLKCVRSGSAIPEWCGGWLLPLKKSHGSGLPRDLE